MVWPLWNFACGGQLGFRTWVSLQSARKEAVVVRIAQRVRRMRPAVRGGRGPGMAFYFVWFFLYSGWICRLNIIISR